MYILSKDNPIFAQKQGFYFGESFAISVLKVYANLTFFDSLVFFICCLLAVSTDRLNTFSNGVVTVAPI
jgi:hypothetical protein